MATSSVLKDVKITSDRAEGFVHTLEKADISEIRDVDISKPVSQLPRESIKKIFCE